MTSKICPRCNISFDCKANDISHCQCNVEISKNTLEFLSKTNFDCLCVSCLQYYDQLVIMASKFNFPSPKEELIEGIHYYLDNDNWVFTELFHLLRGYCCKNGCRHCVYGFKKGE